jgi:hypothetical protein
MATAMSPPRLPSSQLCVNAVKVFTIWKNCVGGNVMLRSSVISEMPEDDSYESAYQSSLEEQITRLQSVVAYLLEKNERLRLFIAEQCENKEMR